MRGLSPIELDKLRHGDTGWVKGAPKRGAYLEYVNALSKKWPHLQFLSDFMEVGTHPLRWDSTLSNEPGAFPNDTLQRNRDVAYRHEKVHVCLLQYGQDRKQPVTEKRFMDARQLTNALEGLSAKSATKLNLIVVEDLSRNVIEVLGSHFDIDPSFFRQHLADYSWFNLGSWWRDPPNLDIASSAQNWLTIRFIRARCFASTESFNKGKKSSNRFNVYRRLDNDHNESPHWDVGVGRESRIGHMRSRASLWIDPTAAPDGPATAILLLDPTISEGDLLWYSYRNWETPPSMRNPDAYPESARDGPNKPTFFDDFIYWARNPDGLHFKRSIDDTQDPPSMSPLDIPMSALLHIISAEWLTIMDYTQTRLNQIDLELTFPIEAENIRNQLNQANMKMHHWRRAIPLYRKMVGESLIKVFRDMSHIPGIGSQQLPSILKKFLDTDAINAYKTDFLITLASMQELQARFDRLSEVAAAAATTEESRSNNLLNERLSNLTWLATTFLPLSLVAGLLSVQEDVTALGNSISYWARIAIPLTAATMLVLVLVEVVPKRYKKFQEKKETASKKGQGGFVRRTSSMFSTPNSPKSGSYDKRITTDMSLRVHQLTRPRH